MEVMVLMHSFARSAMSRVSGTVSKYRVPFTVGAWKEGMPSRMYCTFSLPDGTFSGGGNDSEKPLGETVPPFFLSSARRLPLTAKIAAFNRSRLCILFPPEDRVLRRRGIVRQGRSRSQNWEGSS